MPEFSIESIDFDSPWVPLAIVVATVAHDDLTCLVAGSAVAAGEAVPVATGLLTQRVLPDCALLLLAGMIYVSLFIGTAATVGRLNLPTHQMPRNSNPTPRPPPHWSPDPRGHSPLRPSRHRPRRPLRDRR